MKKYFLLASLLVTTLLPVRSLAQVNVNVNIGSQPLWGPVGYNRVDYYYLPDIETYYYVPRRQFVYLNGNNWIFSSAMPSRYSNYNLYNGYKVVLNSPRPYLNFNSHKIKYAKYKGARGQSSIKYSKNPNYTQVARFNGNGNSYRSSGKFVSQGQQKFYKAGGKQSHGSGGKGKGNKKGKH